MNEKIAAFQGLRKVLKSQTRANFTHVQQNADGFRKSRENCSFFLQSASTLPSVGKVHFSSFRDPEFFFPRSLFYKLLTLLLLSFSQKTVSFLILQTSVPVRVFFTNVVRKFSLDFPTVKLGKGVNFSYLGCIKKKKKK